MSTNAKQLPKWMLKKSVKEEKNLQNKPDAIPSNVGLRKTIYFLSEKELLDTAKEVLKQAGREDHTIHNLERKSKKNNRKAHISSEEEKSDLTTSSSSPYKRETDSPDIFSELSDSTGSEISKHGKKDNYHDKRGQNSKNLVTQDNVLSSASAEITPVKRGNKEKKEHPNVKRTKPDLSILDEIFT